MKENKVYVKENSNFMKTPTELTKEKICTKKERKVRCKKGRQGNIST